VRLPEVFRTATFRTTLLVSVAFGASTLLLFGFIYWQTAGLETARIDQFLLNESRAISRESLDAVVADVDTRYASDLHRESFAAVFSPRLRRLAGDISAYPEALPQDGRPRRVTVARSGSDGQKLDQVRAVARRMTDGRILVVGRSDQDIARLRDLVLRALELGLLPALVSALCVGIFASRRTLDRVASVNRTVARIIQGHLHERLAANPAGDALDQLAAAVNRMLDDIERLVEEIRGVGDDIAHDLRSPLARMRARLEGALGRAQTRDDMADAVGRAIADLDQAFGMITALLRIGQIEGSARRAGFAPVSLSAIAREAMELYQPVADLRGVTLTMSLAPDMIVQGDRDLLFEAAANLLDNAVKFTPAGGSVAVRTHDGGNGAVFSVRDSGPGIAAPERDAVLKRFHRGDRSRHVAGHGLGLSLVAAIVRLHLFHLHMGDAAPGLLIEMRCWPAPVV
jgi:signal transduction histidine kinase